MCIRDSLKCREFVRQQFLGELTEATSSNGGLERSTDFKSLLQENLQAKGRSIPQYVVVGSTGPAHHKVFDIELRLEERVVARERGSSKKEAEQKCAATALELLAQE